MNIAIRGYYKRGRLILIKNSPFKLRAEVFMTFQTDDSRPTIAQKRSQAVKKEN